MTTETRREANSPWAERRCKVCRLWFPYSAHLKTPPETCGLWACMKAAGDPLTEYEA